MKKMTCIIMMMLFPLLGFTQDAKKEAPKNEGPKKATINSYRVFAKDGHNEALKTAIAAHAQKFHSGNWKWRVSEVISGPDSGAYMILEGPNSWTDLEGRGDLGAEHNKDYEANISPHVEKSTPELYATYVPEASTVAAGAFSNKTLIRRSYLKPGHGPHFLDTLKSLKKVWEKRGQNVGVWSSFYSGVPSYVTAWRLKNGWKDLDEEIVGFRKVADEVIGPGGFDRLMDDVSRDIDRTVDEMIEFKPELSSK